MERTERGRKPTPRAEEVDAVEEREEPAVPLTADERVMAASEDSFPASDPPGWIAGSATPCEEPA